MARRSHHVRGRLKSQSFRYIVPVLLIIVLILAVIYSRFDKDEGANDIANSATKTNITEIKTPEPQRGPLLQPLFEPRPPPPLEPIPELVPEPHPELPMAAQKQDSQGVATVTDVAPNPETKALIEQAMTLISDEPSSIVDARTKLIEALPMTMSRQQRTLIMDQISALADKMLLSIKLDGLFQDWHNYKVGWPETGKEGVYSEHDIDIKEFYYMTDNNYLYLFFKCTPSILERYQKYSFSGTFAWLYIDSDSNKDTGATKIIRWGGSGNSAMLGTEYRISVPIGVYISSVLQSSGCHIEYHMHKWDSSSKDFSIQIRKESSYHPNSLIAHGDDGIEIALLLSDIQMSQGQKFDFICLDAAHYANRIQVKIE
ncbi:MAG: hypothetical protein FVQ84_13905 [Planctomycetes bacterium]|nr:hypothetical protein [Planctomycetota bacterium]